MLPRKLGPNQSEHERLRWKVIRLDTHTDIAGFIIEADCDAGVAKMRERGPDDVKDGVRTPTFREVLYSLGAGSIAIVRR